MINKWIKQYDIPVYMNQHLEEVVKVDRKITELVMEDGSRYKGTVFLDCSYEGDGLARAGISFYVGRESNSTYQEIYNGIQFGAPHHKFEKWIDPYVEEGQPDSGLLPGLTESQLELGYQRQGDNRIQA